MESLQGATILHIEGGNDSKIPVLLQQLLAFLVETELPIFIVDVWHRSDHAIFHVDGVQHWQISKDRLIYKINQPIILEAREYWFDTRCTLFGACASNAALESYIIHKHYSPEKALRYGYLSAFVCGDETGSYCVGFKTQHRDLFQGLGRILE